MNETLVKALESLDTLNDNHWTAEGLPKLEALRFAYGSAVTRDEVEAVAPGYTRSNRVFVPDATAVQVKEGDAVVSEPEQAGTEGARNIGSLTATVHFDVDQLVQTMLTPLELTPVGELTDEELQHLAENHSAIVAADRQLIEALTDRAEKRARYLSTVSGEMELRNPPPSMAEAMAAFRARVSSGDTSKLAANKPRVAQRSITPLLKG